MSKIESVKAAAHEILSDYPSGMRFRDLVAAVRATGLDWEGLPQYIQWLPERDSDVFYKPSRGIFALVVSADNAAARSENGILADTEAATESSTSIPIPVLTPPTSPKEQDFYASFADYIVNELDECSRAVSLGGAGFGGKWGTPDVVGVVLPRLRDLYRPPIELVCAEIKIVANAELITAFGQVCSYQLFSHKTYIVVPNDAKDNDLDRLETLCHLFGIGLVLFDKTSVQNPDYRIRLRAQRREPDRFYINEILTHRVFDGLLSQQAIVTED